MPSASSCFPSFHALRAFPLHSGSSVSPSQGAHIAWSKLICGRTKSGQGREALRLYRRMREEGFIPNTYTFVAALKACCSTCGGLEAGKRIHGHVIGSGHGTDIYVATCLVDMYGRCGNIGEARNIFEQMQHRNVVSWTAIIVSYAHLRMGGPALELYARMRREGLLPNPRTYVAALKACGSLAGEGELRVVNGAPSRTFYLEKGRAIHAEVAERGLEEHIFVASALVDMYGKCGSIDEAQCIFDKMRHRNLVSWTALIIGYAKMKMADLSLELFARMQHEGFTPDSRTFVAALKACGSLVIQEGEKGLGSSVVARCLEKGRAIHTEVAKRGLESDIFVASTLVDMYGKCGSMEDARHVFEKMRHRNLVSWTALIMGYAEIEMGHLALELYERMQIEGFTPDACTYVAALKACGSIAAQEGKGVGSELLKTSCLEHGRTIHADLKRRGFGSDIFVATTLVDMYAKCGSIKNAHDVFEKMSYRNVVAWNALIIGYANMEMGDSSLEAYACMQHEGCAPDAHTFVAVLKACASMVAQEGNEANVEDLRPRYLEQGRAIHAELARKGFESHVFIANTLVDMYAKCGSIKDAYQVFENMSHHDALSWNIMISGCIQMEMWDLALELYALMRTQGLLPNANTFVAALKACGGLASLETGKEIHSQLHRLGLDNHLCIANCLVDMYGKCGSMVDARQVFDSLLIRDSVTWGVLIAGYSGQGDSESVFDLCKRMEEEGIEVDGITHMCILSACSHNGLLDKGQMYFRSMYLKFGLPQSNNHYTCIIDLLGRAGQLDEALTMLKKMPFRPDAVTWVTILSASRKWNSMAIGRNAYECAVALDEDHLAPYVLMTNICSCQIAGGQYLGLGGCAQAWKM